MQKVSSSLIQSISTSQLLRGNAIGGQVLSYNESLGIWDPLTLVTLESISAVGINVDLSGSSTFSLGNMALGTNTEGPFFGRVALSENYLTVTESSIGKQWKFVPDTRVKTLNSGNPLL